MDNIKVSVKNMTKKFGDLLVLDDVSFDVKKGEFLCVVGPTGCGKTTFLNCITKLYEPTAGEILIDGEPVDLRKHNVSYIFQEYSCMPWLNVEENIAFGLHIKHRPESEVKQAVDEAIEMVGLQDFRRHYPNQLSASMLQRVVIARAFATKPELLLMDEPYGQLPRPDEQADQDKRAHAQPPAEAALRHRPGLHRGARKGYRSHKVVVRHVQNRTA